MSVNQPLTVIRVKRLYTEQVMRWIHEHNLQDFAWKIKHSGDFIYIPLKNNQIPISPELEKLGVTIGSINQFPEVIPFIARTKPAITLLKAAIGDIVPLELCKYVPRSFDIIGTIAILEFDRTEQAALKSYLIPIARRLMTLHPNITSVYSKVGDVEGDYRIRKLELLLGNPSTETIHKENGCQFYLDIEQIFFTPRLVFERKRIAELKDPQIENIIQRGITWDMFCGVGPFLIQIAKRHHTGIFLGTDINPAAIAYAQKNLQKNKITCSVDFYVQDITKIMETEWIKSYFNKISRIIMNLPEKNIQFLKYLPPFLHADGALLHFYQFNEKSHALEEAEQIFRSQISNLELDIVKIHNRRIVKPYSPSRSTTVLDVIIRKRRN